MCDSKHLRLSWASKWGSTWFHALRNFFYQLKAGIGVSFLSPLKGTALAALAEV